MSGTPSTRKTSPTMNVTMSSLRSIAHTFLLSDVASDLAEDFFHRADRVRQGRPHRL